VKSSRATFAHTGLVLNEHWTPTNPPVFDPTQAKDTITVDRLLIRPQFRSTAEALHLAQGGTAGRVHKGMLAMQAQGRILVPDATQMASLEDREKALRLAFDPYECYRDSPATDGVYALSWLEPTLDTTNYPTGWMPVRRYVRPVGQPETQWTVTDKSNRQWSVNLVAPDPRLYDTTLGSLSTSGGSFVLTNHGTIPGPLRVTIVMSGSGESSFGFTTDGVTGFVLDLSGCHAGDVVVAVMETCGPFGTGRSITKNGVSAFGLKTSASTGWPIALVGSNTCWTYNETNVAYVLFEWGHARP
jgi:hypothetical protein